MDKSISNKTTTKPPPPTTTTKPTTTTTTNTTTTTTNTTNNDNDKHNKIFQNIVYCMYSLDYVQHKMSFISLTIFIRHWPVAIVFTMVYLLAGKWLIVVSGEKKLWKFDSVCNVLTLKYPSFHELKLYFCWKVLWNSLTCKVRYVKDDILEIIKNVNWI